MRAAEPLFSLTAVCHFLSLHPSSPQSAASCPSLMASDVPPAPSGTAQDFTLSLRNVQEVGQTTSRRVAALGLGPTHACCETDWNQAETYGVFTSSWVTHRWMYECCNLGQWMCKTGVYGSSKRYETDRKIQASLCQPPLSFQDLARPMFFQRCAELCPRQHTVAKRSTHSRIFNTPVLAPNSATPDHFLSPIHVHNPH